MKAFDLVKASFSRYIGLFLFGAVISLLHACAALDEGSLAGPTQTAMGPDGNIYVADGYYNARIAIFTTNGRFIRQFGTPGFGQGEFHTPHGLAFGGAGELYVADRGNARVQIFSRDGQYLREYNSASLGHVFSVALAPGGNLFAADGGTQLPPDTTAGISEISLQGNILQKSGKYGNAAGDFNEPHMMAVPDNNTIYVAETGTPRVQKLIRSACGYAVCPFTAVPGWPSAAANSTLVSPLSVAIAANGNIWIGFQGNSPGVAQVSANTGDILFVIGHPKLRRPHGITTDPEGSAWVTDNETSRVFRIRSAAQIDQILGD